MTKQHKHPKGLYVLFFTEMWERFSYYGLRAVLVLFMANALLYDKASAAKIFGTFATLVYLMPLVGGYIADKYWGNRKAIYIGGILIAIAQFILFASARYTSVTWEQLDILLSNELIDFFQLIFIDLITPSHTLLYLGLFLLILGNGFFKPNISNLVGGLYADKDTRKDTAYTLFYMGINLGAFFSPLVCGYFSNEATHDYQYGFLVAGIGMIFGLCTFFVGKKHLNTVDGKALGVHLQMDKNNQNNINYDGILINSNKKLTVVEIQKISVIFILSIFMVAFWGCFEQAGTALTYYADEQVEKPIINFLGLHIMIKASYFQSVNPLFILIFAPIFGTIWLKLGAKNKEIPSVIKMVLGMIFLGLGFYILVLSSDFTAPNTLSNPLWLVAAYGLHTFGELCLSPIGLSLVNKLSPARFASLMFAIWFGASAFGNYLAGIIGSLYPEKGKTTYLLGWNISSLSDYFLLSTVLPILTAILLIVIYPFLKKWMHDVQ